jgi:hypothetical protein
MTKHNAENERIKREYLEHLRGGMGLSEHSIDMAAKAVHRFEEFSKFRSFLKFHIEQAKAFRSVLMLRPSWWWRRSCNSRWFSALCSHLSSIPSTRCSVLSSFLA